MTDFDQRLRSYAGRWLDDQPEPPPVESLLPATAPARQRRPGLLTAACVAGVFAVAAGAMLASQESDDGAPAVTAARSTPLDGTDWRLDYVVDEERLWYVSHPAELTLSFGRGEHMSVNSCIDFSLDVKITDHMIHVESTRIGPTDKAAVDCEDELIEVFDQLRHVQSWSVVDHGDTLILTSQNGELYFGVQ